MVQPKTVSKILNVTQVEKMLQHFEINKFIKINTKGIQFGFLTESLQDFVRKEWLQSNLVGSDWPSFLFSALKTKENLKAALEDVKNLAGTVPFSLIEIVNPIEIEEKVPESGNAIELVSNHFKKQTGTILRNQTFCSHANAVEIFHKKQRERKNWWRKFSAQPGRFITSNAVSNEDDKSIVCEIQADFPWGLETVETIKYFPDFGLKETTPPEAQASKRKKSTTMVTCEAMLENAAFTYLCDSYAKLNVKTDRDVLKFSRELAPFKVAIAGTGSTNEVVKSLEEVSLLLAKQVRKLGFSVLLLHDACTMNVERQMIRNDALGVPYSLILNDKTLQVGIIALRSRDTTLQEDSHVSLITDYLGRILN